MADASSTARTYVTFCATVFVVACGGGNSSSNGGGNPVTQTPPPSLSITQGNARVIAETAIGSGEAILMMAHEAVFALQKVDDTALYTHPNNCLLGWAEYELTDADLDNRLSAGDSVRASFQSCETTASSGTLLGEITITMVTVDAASRADDVHYVADVDLDAVSVLSLNGSTITGSGEFRLEYIRGIYESSLTATGDPGIAATVNASTSASWRNLNIIKQESYEDAQYEVLLSGSISSNRFNGTATVATLQPFGSFFNTFPTSGELQISGQDVSKLNVVPDMSIAADAVAFNVDENGDGSYVKLQDSVDWGYFTWGYLWWYELYSPHEYRISAFDINDFVLMNERPYSLGNFGGEWVGVNPTIRLQMSRRIDASSVPATIQLDPQYNDWPFEETPVDLDIEVRGAMLILRPTEQLRYGAGYSFPLEDFYIADEIGNEDYISHFYTSGVAIRNELNSVASPAETFGMTSEAISLTGEDSFAIDGPGLEYQWSQIAGPSAMLVGATSRDAIVTLPAAAGASLVRIQLQVTNAAGEIDLSKADITLFPAAADIDLAVLRVIDGNDELVEWLFTSANGEQVIREFDSHRIFVDHNSSKRFGDDMTWNFRTPDGTPFAAGSYENITSTSMFEGVAAMSMWGAGYCGLQVGRFDVLEATYDPDGKLTSAAIDFEWQCEDSWFNRQLYGHVRLASDIPIPGPPDPTP
ncbi:MAG: Ig-like domain-containing protein [Gammaproteobacteria bacterium]|nr:Ig-like domain-containing protein [Gammaproteobacteria bacterium]